MVSAALSDLNDCISELNTAEYLSFNVHKSIINANKSKVEFTIGSSEDCDIVTKNEAPLYIKSVARKMGNRWVPLTKLNSVAIDSYFKEAGVPSAYCYETEFDDDLDTVIGLITLNAYNTTGVRVTWLETLPEFKINDEINLPSAYVNLVEAALAVKTAMRYTLPYLPMYSDELEALKESLERINQANRPIVYTAGEGDSYTDNYYNGLCPSSW